jgi:cell filamentation protein
MYEADQDPDCYPGTSVLKNRFGLLLQTELDKAEQFAVAKRQQQPLPTGRLSYGHYRAIHRHLFRDVYGWAGRIRRVRIHKGDSTFCYPDYIDGEMRRLFDHLADENFFRDLEAKDFAAKAARFIADLNAIHPFREGNGRTQNIFLAMMADRAGHPLDFSRLDPEAMLAAMLASFRGDERPLAKLILRLMRARN